MERLSNFRWCVQDFTNDRAVADFLQPMREQVELLERQILIEVLFSLSLSLVRTSQLYIVPAIACGHRPLMMKLLNPAKKTYTCVSHDLSSLA